MKKKGAGGIAAVIAAGTVLLEFGIQQIATQFADGGPMISWLPQFGTAGQTVVVYLYVNQVLTFVLAVGGVAGLGYWIGARLDVSHEYRAVFGIFALGGGIGHLCGMLLFGALFRNLSVSADLFLGLGIIIGMAIATALQFGLVGLAGAALAQFRIAQTPPRTDGHPTESRASVDIE